MLEMVDIGSGAKRNIELGGTMPESLPLAENIKKITSKNKKQVENK